MSRLHCRKSRKCRSQCLGNPASQLAASLEFMPLRAHNQPVTLIWVWCLSPGPPASHVCCGNSGHIPCGNSRHTSSDSGKCAPTAHISLVSAADTSPAAAEHMTSKDPSVQSNMACFGAPSLDHQELKKNYLKIARGPAAEASACRYGQQHVQ